MPPLKHWHSQWHPYFKTRSKGTVQTLNTFLPGLAFSMPLDAGCQIFIACLAAHLVGNRPDRFEPRRIKRRPKSHDLLRKPRHEYKRLAA